MNLLHSSLLNSAQCPFVMHSSSLLYFEAFSSILFFAVLSILFCTILFSSTRGYLLQPILFKLVLIYVFSCQSHQVCSKSISRFVNEIRLKHIKPFSWWRRAWRTVAWASCGSTGRTLTRLGCERCASITKHVRKTTFPI